MIQLKLKPWMIHPSRERRVLRRIMKNNSSNRRVETKTVANRKEQQQQWWRRQRQRPWPMLNWSMGSGSSRKKRRPSEEDGEAWQQTGGTSAQQDYK